jgi:hypothetical protein
MGVKWTRYVVHVGGTRNANKILVIKYQGNYHPLQAHADGKTIKKALRETRVKVSTEMIWLRTRTSGGLLWSWYELLVQ